MTDPTKPKLIIDEDWKTQVQREREEAQRQSKEGTPNAQSDPSHSASDSVEQPSAVKQSQASQNQSETSPRDSEDVPPPPPASFAQLISILGTQALVAMGQMGDGQDAPKPRLDYAKHFIDLMGMLEEKTKGNLAAEESKLISDWLYQLRIGYVEIAKRA